MARHHPLSFIFCALPQPLDEGRVLWRGQLLLEHGRQGRQIASPERPRPEPQTGEYLAVEHTPRVGCQGLVDALVQHKPVHSSLVDLDRQVFRRAIARVGAAFLMWIVGRTAGGDLDD